MASYCELWLVMTIHGYQKNNYGYFKTQRLFRKATFGIVDALSSPEDMVAWRPLASSMIS